MKKILILIALCLCTNFTVLANDDAKMLDISVKKESMTKWLESNPYKAKELKEILSDAQNPTAALEKWLKDNPDCERQLHNLLIQ